MTIKEMSDEFDLLYDVASEEAPGLNSYEKSVFLTKGMLELAEQRYEEYLNRASRGFHDDELNRDALKGFIASAVIELEKTPVISSKKMKRERILVGNKELDEDFEESKIEHTVPGSKFFKRPFDSMGILYEDVIIQPKKIRDRRRNRKVAVVSPVRYDHVIRLLRNPFTKPTEEVAFRLDHSDYDGYSLSEIICNENYSPLRYRMKYVKTPYPIILEDLNETYPDQGLSIENQTKPYSRDGSNKQATNIDNTIHHEIVQRGVELAILHYRENTLQTNMQAKINKTV
jgi:hypothetical protein